ncbi:MAG: pyridoxal phosphate-dependent aminotransferase [Desulfuromonadaceae bacterium]
MNIPLSRRCLDVTPFLAMEIMERAKALEAAGRDIIYLCLGEPDFPTPQPVLEAAVAALRGGATSYTHSLGLIELRQAISDHYRRRYRVDIDPGRILVSAGTSPLLLMLCAALLESGDEVILPDPGYSCYPNFVRFAGGRPVWLRTRVEDGFQPRLEDVRDLLTARTRAVLINSPSNPVGTILSAERLEQLATLPVPLIADEIYHGLTYHGEEHSILEFTDQAFVLGGFSKTFAMTGWRLGFLIAPSACIRPLQSLHQNFMICANHFVQRAGIAALAECGQELAEMRQTYDARRHYLLERLNELGLKVAGQPVGAFYALAEVRHIDPDSKRLALDILEQTGVALTPGVDFGAAAEGYLRFSYANSLTHLKKALDRLEIYLRRRSASP